MAWSTGDRLFEESIDRRRFFMERFNSPTGRMIVITDQVQHLRVVDWEDCESRMRNLFRRQYGEGL